jgi:hypothetical protein
MSYAYACMLCQHKCERAGALRLHLTKKKRCVVDINVERLNIKMWNCPAHPSQEDLSFEDFVTHLTTVHRRGRAKVLPKNTIDSSSSRDGFSSGEEEGISRGESKHEDEIEDEEYYANNDYNNFSEASEEELVFSLPSICSDDDDDEDDCNVNNDNGMTDEINEEFDLENVQPFFEGDDEDDAEGGGDDEFKTTILDVLNNPDSTLTDMNIEKMQREVFESEAAQTKMDVYFWAMKWGITHKAYNDLLNIKVFKQLNESKDLPMTLQTLDRQMLSLFKDKLPLKQLEVEDASGKKYEAGFVLPSEIIALALSDSATHQQIIESNNKYLGSSWGQEGKLERLIEIA